MIRLLFFGTPHCSARVLEYLVGSGFTPVGIVTRADKPRGRSGAPQSPPIKELAQRLIPAVPLFQPVSAADPSFLQEVHVLKPDLFVVVAYGQILKQQLLDLAPFGAINVHPSLLPKCRGAAPVQWTLIRGETATGVVIMKIDAAMDAGDILATAHCPIEPQMNAGELSDRLFHLSLPLLHTVLTAYGAGKPQHGVPQDHSQATLAPKITDTQLHIDRDAHTLHNWIRALAPEPGAWLAIALNNQPKRLKVLQAALDPRCGRAGEILSWGREGIVIATGAKALLLQRVQLEGKAICSAAQFAAGYPSGSVEFFSLTDE